MLAVQEVRDDVANRVETYVTTNLEGVWDLVERVPAVHRRVNGILIDRAILKFPTRPNPLTTMAPYTSWASLTDRTYSGRHLPPRRRAGAGRPRPRPSRTLFNRDGEMSPCAEVDGAVLVLRAVVHRRVPAQRAPASRPRDRRADRDPRERVQPRDRPHPDLYGLDADVTRQLRAFEGGRLQSPAAQRRGVPAVPVHDGAAQAEFDRVTVLRVRRSARRAARDQLFAMGSDTGEPAARLRDA